MDELLALMEDSGEEDSLTASSPYQPLVGTEEEKSNATDRISTSRHRPSLENAHPTLTTSQTTVVNTTTCQGRAEASIDDRLGIRMIKRQISSIDLMDLVASHPYHSTATISAMSRAALNRLLVEPAAVISEATVCGKMAIVTVGIVFTNSGTRISAKGRAFSVLSVGNLNTGPVVSVFLFGEAYSRHCAKCAPGTVVALVTPSLLPPKEGSRDTSVAFSVADQRKLVAVARARDYGVCKGTVSTKRADGQWTSNAGQCKNHVDVRVSQYCEKHRKQQNVKNGPMKQGLSFMQQQRLGQQAKPPSNKLSAKTPGVMTMHTPAGVVVTHNPRAAGTLSLEAQLDAFENGPRPLKAPLHMKKQVNPVPPLNNARLVPGGMGTTGRQMTTPTNSRQPLQHAQTVSKHMSKTVATKQPLHASNTRVRTQPVTDDWLSNPRGRLTNEKNKSVQKKRTIYRDTGGFDGSVVVPKPNKLFRAKAPLSHRQAASVAQLKGLDETKVDSVLQRQRLVAEGTKMGASLATNASSSKMSKPNAKRPRRIEGPLADDALKESLFGKLRDIDVEKVLNAKSEFAEEADAEAYAKSRRLVADLERREEQKNLIEANKKKASGVSTKDSAIQKEWICATCNKSTKIMPKLCIRAKHKVTYKRDVKASATATEKRLQLDEKDVQDGGLKLGAGLEWDRRWQRF